MSGSNYNVPLIHYTIVDGGRADMAPDSDIIIAFTTNVVNLNVKENNLKCFKLTDSEGIEVPMKVEMGDDQVDRSIRRLVTINPDENLTKGETYKVFISKELTSKNGVSMEDDISFEVTVGSGKGAGDAEADIMDLTLESTLDLNEPPKKNSFSPALIGAIIILFTAFVGTLIFKKIKYKK